MSLQYLVSLKFPLNDPVRTLTRSIYFLNGSLVMASGQSVRSFFTPAAKKMQIP